jgi:hypothetical protein
VTCWSWLMHAAYHSRVPCCDIRTKRAAACIRVQRFCAVQIEQVACVYSTFAPFGVSREPTAPARRCRLAPLFPETLMVGMELRDKVSEYVKDRIGTHAPAS